MKKLLHSAIISGLLIVPFALHATTPEGSQSMDTPTDNVTTTTPEGSQSMDTPIENSTISGATEYPYFHSAPEELNVNDISTHAIRYNSWELMHRIPMLSGFTWTGVVANFITPQMYIGTPLMGNQPQYPLESVESTDSSGTGNISDPTTYTECLKTEAYISYGLGERIESTDIAELKAIAKTCAQQFYGTYFYNKPETTREEFLMMLFGMFESGVKHEGEFSSDGEYVEKGNGVDSGFSNINPKAWYSPYLARAKELNLITQTEATWTTDQEINDAEAVDILARYTAYRMDAHESILQKGIIINGESKYFLTFLNPENVTIRIQ